LPELIELSPFSVFCALHLGITETDGYADQDKSAVARRFGVTPEALREFMEQHRLRSEDLRAAEFDVGSARLDIKVAPQGISRTELARTLFAELTESLPVSGNSHAAHDSPDRLQEA
jgi:transposase-like protein